MAALPVDDRDLDDAALWAVIDSAAASVASFSSPTALNTSCFRKPLTLKHPNFHSPPNLISPPPPPPPPSHHKLSKSPRCFNSHDHFHRPQKHQKSSSSCISEVSNSSSHSPVVNHWPIKKAHQSPVFEHHISDDKENSRHCLSGRFPTVSLFKDYQNAAMSVLEKSDYIMISGNPYIKKSGWRKIAFYFNVSFEIRDKSIEFDDNRNVQRAEFLVRAYMQGGRFSDGWGSCECREKKFMKPNNDIPSTAETRAKNRACQDLIGIGQYRPGASHSPFPSPR